MSQFIIFKGLSITFEASMSVFKYAGCLFLLLANDDTCTNKSLHTNFFMPLSHTCNSKNLKCAYFTCSRLQYMCKGLGLH